MAPTLRNVARATSTTTAEPSGKPLEPSTMPETTQPPSTIPAVRRASSASATAQPPTKKAKPSSSIDTSERIIEIVLEDEESSKIYKIHENLLRYHSGYFDERLDKFDGGKPLVLKKVDKMTFETFAQWLYRGFYEVPNLQAVARLDDKALEEYLVKAQAGALNGTVHNRDLDLQHLSGFGQAGLTLARMYEFAFKFQAERLEELVLVTIQHQYSRLKALPPLVILKYVFESTGLDSRLCEFFVACYACHGRIGIRVEGEDQTRGGGRIGAEWEAEREELLSRMPSKLLAAILTFVFGMAHSGKPREEYDPMRRNNWCRYHRHKDEAARNQCPHAVPRAKDKDTVKDVVESPAKGVPEASGSLIK